MIRAAWCLCAWLVMGGLAWADSAAAPDAKPKTTVAPEATIPLTDSKSPPGPCMMLNPLQRIASAYSITSSIAVVPPFDTAPKLLT